MPGYSVDSKYIVAFAFRILYIFSYIALFFTFHKNRIKMVESAILMAITPERKSEQMNEPVKEMSQRCFLTQLMFISCIILTFISVTQTYTQTRTYRKVK